MNKVDYDMQNIINYFNYSEFKLKLGKKIETK